MALKITRARDHSQVFRDYQRESSTLISARYEYEADAERAHRPTITAKVREFSDARGDLHDESVKQLFDQLWKKLGTDKRSDVVLDFSLVRGICPRFQRELNFLRRRIRHPGSSVRLLNVSLPGDQERLLDTL